MVAHHEIDVPHRTGIHQINVHPVTVDPALQMQTMFAFGDQPEAGAGLNGDDARHEALTAEIDQQIADAFAEAAEIVRSNAAIMAYFNEVEARAVDAMIAAAPTADLERLKLASEMIGRMAHDQRPPKMSIPVQPYDEDIFITVTLADAAEAIEGKKNDRS